jgi:hypothetical protein
VRAAVRHWSCYPPPLPSHRSVSPGLCLRGSSSYHASAAGHPGLSGQRLGASGQPPLGRLGRPSRTTGRLRGARAPRAGLVGSSGAAGGWEEGLAPVVEAEPYDLQPRGYSPPPPPRQPHHPGYNDGYGHQGYSEYPQGNVHQGYGQLGLGEALQEGRPGPLPGGLVRAYAATAAGGGPGPGPRAHGHSHEWGARGACAPGSRSPQQART